MGTIIGMPDGGIVLVKRAIEPGFGLWVFPGGFVDRGEDVRLAAVREAREEAGIDIRLDELVGIYSYAGSLPVVIVYRATWTAGELAVDDENSEIRTFAAADLPWNELAFRSTRDSSATLKDYFAACRVRPDRRLALGVGQRPELGGGTARDQRGLARVLEAGEVRPIAPGERPAQPHAGGQRGVVHDVDGPLVVGIALAIAGEVGQIAAGGEDRRSRPAPWRSPRRSSAPRASRSSGSPPGCR